MKQVVRRVIDRKGTVQVEDVPVAWWTLLIVSTTSSSHTVL